MSRLLIAVVGGLALLASAQLVRGAAVEQRGRWPKTVEQPFAPSPEAAPFVTLGYRELAADLFFIRTKVYFGGTDDTADGLRSLIDAVVTLDPSFAYGYEFGARAISWAPELSLDDLRWSAALLETGLRNRPDRWELAYLAGQIYVLDLAQDKRATPAEIAAWKARGLDLLDHAIRMPDAPRNLGTMVAFMRSEMGQLDRAVRDLQELIAITDDPNVRKKLIARLAELEGASADRVEQEKEYERERLDRAWKASLPEAPVDMYLIVGDKPKPYIDLGDLAAGPDVVSALEDDEPFEPLVDP